MNTNETATKTSIFYKKQLLSVLILAGIVVLLVVALLVTNDVISRYVLTDTYTKDGETITLKYYIHKDKEGNYAPYTKFFGGEKLTCNEDGYYIIPEDGNQYSVDATSGDYSLYAVVDYDAESGETLGYASRVMIFPQIRQANVYSIEVENEYGSYKFYRGETGTVYIEGFEDNSFIAYDQELYAYLCVSCGYTLTTRKINEKSSEFPRTSDGEIDYSAYGLDTPQAKYTITSANIVENDDTKTYSASDTSYTVYIGDLVMTGGGYYAKLEGRDAIYVVSTDLESTLLQPVENLVTAMTVYTASISTNGMVQNFVFSKLPSFDLSSAPKKANYATDEEYQTALSAYTSNFSKSLTDNLIVAFSYEDLEYRMNTLNQTVPYYIPDDYEFLQGYLINDDNATQVFSDLYEMEVSRVVKVGFTTADLKKYHLDENVYYMSYYPAVLDSDSNVYYTTDLQNIILISEVTENGTYYVASFLSQMIVEVDRSYLTFLDWDKTDWYCETFVTTNIAYITDMSVKIGAKTFTFRFDNSNSYTFTADDGNTYRINFGTTSPKYYMSTDDDGKYTGDAKINISSANIRIFLVTSDGEEEIDYTYYYNYESDSGQQKVKAYTGILNFRYLYQVLLTYSIEGTLDEAEYLQKTGKTIEYSIKNDTPTFELEYTAEDLAKYLNWSTYTDSETGITGRIYTSNLSAKYRIRLYQFDDWKAALTVEQATKNDDGEWVYSDEVVSMFYVDANVINKIESDLEKTIAGNSIPVDANGVREKNIYTKEEYNKYIVDTSVKY